MRKQRVLFVWIILLTVVATGCESEAEREREKAERVQTKSVLGPDGSIHLTTEQIQANGLQTTLVNEIDVAPRLTAIGRVKPRAGGEAQVFSPFPGQIIARTSQVPHPGDSVRQGQLIAEVEQQFMASEKLQFNATAVQLQASIEQAQQEVELRQTEVARAQQLYDGGAIPLKQLQSAQFDLKTAESRLSGARQAKQQYDAAQSQENSASRKAPIIAPITGTVTATDFVPGQQVDPAKSLMTIIDLSDVWIEAAVHENDLSSVRSVRTAEISLPNAGGRKFAGNIVTIGNIVDPNNRTVPITFDVLNADRTLKIGMFVEAAIPTGPAAKGLAIPGSAVLSDETGFSVFVEAEPGVYRRKVVAIGERRGDFVLVTSGLSSGEKVVSTGAQILCGESLKSSIPSEDEGEQH